MGPSRTKRVKHNNNSISKAFEKLPKMLAKRQKELDDQENAIKQEREALEKERKIYGATKGSDYDVLHLNVGGNRIDVLRGTLTSVKDSVLESQFSGRWDNTLTKDRYGNFFLDQDYEIFLPLINFLRSKACESHTHVAPLTPPTLATFGNDQDKLIQFLRMTEFYNMTHGLYPFEIDQVAAPAEHEDETIPGTYSPGCNIVTKTSRFMFLRPSQHKCRVRSFEVRLGRNVAALQVGWIHPNNYPGSHASPPFLNQLSDAVSVNAATSQTTVRASYTGTIAGRTIGMEEGTVIRCNRLNYTFELNDDASLIYPKNHTSGTSYSTPSDHHVPAMCGIGSWQITKVLFDP